jgi:type IX secretion system PorP/SprF family membrane protein
MKKLILTQFFLIIISIGFSQQIPQFSQYTRNHFFINPAAAGSYDIVDINIFGRSQWSGFDNSPKSSFVNFSTSIKQKKNGYYNTDLTNLSDVGTGFLKHAIGAQFQMDEYGAFQNMNFSGVYAIHVPINKKINVSFGTKIGFSNNNFISSRAEIKEGTNDNTYIDYTRNNSNNFIFNLGTGLYVYSTRFFFGIAADQLTKNLVKVGSASTNFDPQIYYNTIGGVKLKLNNKVIVTPSFLIKYMTPAPISIEGSIQVEYNKRFWAGISYRNTDAIVGMLGMNINQKMKFGYSYDYSVSRFNRYSSGSHELFLGIMLGNK